MFAVFVSALYLLLYFKRGTYIHEILHALGMEHNQARTDRDKHLIMKLENVEEENTEQFEKLEHWENTNFGKLIFQGNFADWLKLNLRLSL